MAVAFGDVPLDPEMERPQPAQDEEAVERPGHRRPSRSGGSAAARRSRRRGSRRSRGSCPSGRRGTSSPSGRRCRRRARAGSGGPARRTCCRRRGSGRAAPGLGGALADRRRGGGDVDDLQVRVRRALEPDEPRSRGQLLPERVRARPTRSVNRASPAPLGPVDPLEVAVRAAVHVVADEDLLAARRQLGDRGRRRRAARERDPVACPSRARRPPARAARGSG